MNEKIGPLTIEHDRSLAQSALQHLAHVACLLLQLPDGARLSGLAGIDQTRRHLDAYLVDWRSVLLLQQQLRSALLLQDGHDAHTVDQTALGSGQSFGRFPRPFLVIGRVVCRSATGLSSVITANMPGD